MTAALVLVALLGGCDYGTWSPMTSFRVIGHRGAPYGDAENTLPSVQRAVAEGANGIEIDLCVTSDDHVVLWHDADPDGAIALARQSGAEGLPWQPRVPAIGSASRRPVHALTLEELRRHYGYSHDGFPDPYVRIPELYEVLDWARTEPEVRWVYLDVKVTGEAAVRRIVGEVAAAVESGGLEHVRFVAISPDHGVVRMLEDERLRLGMETLEVAPDFEGPGELGGAQGLGLPDISTGLTPSRTWSAFRDDVVELVAARDAGEIESVTVWTFDRRMQLDVMLLERVDGVMTNHPGVLAQRWHETVN